MSESSLGGFADTPPPSRVPTRPASRVPRSTLLFAVPPLVFAVFVYLPITRNGLHEDDFLNLYQIVNAPLLEYLLTPHGGHILIARNAVFFLCYQLFGTQAQAYFATVLVTHLVNVFLLFTLIRVLTRSARLASAGAMLWGVSPLNQVVLGWYSVYGQVLVGTIVLALLVELARTRETPPSGLRIAGWVVLLLAAATSFGIGIGAVLVFPVVAFLLVPKSAGRARIVLVFSVVAAAMPFVYVGLLRLYTLLHGGPDLVSQAAVGLRRWTAIALMLSELVVYGSTRLLVGPVSTRINLPPRIVDAILIAGALLVVSALFTAPPRRRRYMLACIVLCLASYGVISAGRAQLLHTPLVPNAAMLRYHYAPVIPLAVLLCLCIKEVTARLALSAMYKNALLIAWCGLIAIVHARYGSTVMRMEAADAQTAYVLRTIDLLVRAGAPGETVRIPNRRFAGAVWIPPADFPGWAAVFAIFSRDDVVDGRRVVFVDADPEVLAAAKGGRRSAALIVAPADPASLPLPGARRDAPPTPPKE